MRLYLDMMFSRLSVLKNFFFSITIFIFLILLLGASYVRFILNTDYLVLFEGECDPSVASCYQGCNDNDCNDIYYYKLIERDATELYQLCGPSVVDCDKAYTCDNSEKTCNILYCNSTEEDDCVTLTETTL